MGYRVKTVLVAVVLLLAVALASYQVANAVTALYKQVTGTGNVDYVDETTFTDLRVASPTKVQVVLTSNASTVSTYMYTVTLYLDGVAVVPTGSVSWTAGQIPGTSKTVSFTGLALGAVTSMGAEVKK